MSPPASAANAGRLDAERILVAAEDALRRFGPAKMTVVDVSRALGVSHAAVYRHFGSKADLRDAVLGRWLERFSRPLGDISRDATILPSRRLWAWFDALRDMKRRKASDDPELFATYNVLSEEARAVVVAHVAELEAQIETIVRAGIATGDFRAGEPASLARALLLATSPFHKPVYAPQWGNLANDADYAAVRDLIDASLRPA